MTFKSAFRKLIALFQKAHEWAVPKADARPAADNAKRAAPSSRKKPPLRRATHQKKRGTPRIETKRITK